MAVSPILDKLNVGHLLCYCFNLLELCRSDLNIEVCDLNRVRHYGLETLDKFGEDLV